jgi:hypothetical protein
MALYTSIDRIGLAPVDLRLTARGLDALLPTYRAICC